MPSIREKSKGDCSVREISRSGIIDKRRHGKLAPFSARDTISLSFSSFCFFTIHRTLSFWTIDKRSRKNSFVRKSLSFGGRKIAYGGGGDIRATRSVFQERNILLSSSLFSTKYSSKLGEFRKRRIGKDRELSSVPTEGNARAYLYFSSIRFVPPERTCVLRSRSDSVKRDNPLPSPPPSPPPQRPEIFEECRRGLRALFEHLRVCVLLVRFVSRVLDRVDDVERGEDVLRRQDGAEGQKS